MIRIRKNENLFLLFILTLYLISCDRSRDEDDYYEFYSTDKSKLAAEIIDQKLGVKFNPPLNWSLRPAELSIKTESKNKIVNPEAKYFAYQPKYLFFNDSTGSLLSVGLVDYPDTALTPNMKYNLYKNLLSNKYKKDNLSIADFSRANVDYTLFKSEKGNFVNFKIIFENKTKGIIQFDCTITKNHLEKEQEFLKSCIGSIMVFLSQ